MRRRDGQGEMGKEGWAMRDGQREMLFSTCIYLFLYLFACFRESLDRHCSLLLAAAHNTAYAFVLRHLVIVIILVLDMAGLKAFAPLIKHLHLRAHVVFARFEATCRN